MAIDDLMKHRVSIFALYYQIAHGQALQHRESDRELDALKTRAAGKDELTEIALLTDKCYRRR
jgi:hypothetical protein